MARKRTVRTENFTTSPTSATEDVGAWFEDPDGERDAHNRVFRTVRHIESAQVWRQSQRLKHVRMYGNREVKGLKASDYCRTAPGRTSRLAWNVCKSCVDTAAAKIAKNRPKALFLTSGGDAKLQDKAKKLTKFVEGMFEAAHVYVAGQQAFVDACVVDTGVVKVTDDGDDLCVERVFVDELIVDEVEGIYGDPQQIHHRRLMAPGKLIAQYPDKKSQILAARKRDESSSYYVEVIESWHLRSDKKSDDGRRAICIEGCTLAYEPYTRDWLPFVFLFWTLPFRGFFGQGLVEELVGIQVEINKTLQTIQEAQRLACVPRVYFDAASAATLKPITNEMGEHYSYSGRPPVISTANAMPAEVYQHLENLYRKAYEITGISQMGATGKKPSGLDSGAALREYQDIETERFVLVAQRYEEFYMRIARLMIDLMRGREAGKARVKTASGKFVETIDWSQVDMHEDEYEMRVFPISLLPSSPAGRLQTVKELVKDGFIADRSQALKLLDFPDLEIFQSLQTASLDNIHVIVDAILEKGEFASPDRYLNVDLARQIAQAAYERGQAQGRPQERLDLLDTWMQQLDELQDSMTPQAAPAPQMVEMGEGTAAPMMPQLPPPELT